MRKKDLIIIPVALLTLSLTACGNGTDPQKTTETVAEISNENGVVEKGEEKGKETQEKELSQEEQIEQDEQKYKITYDMIKEEVDLDGLKEEYIDMVVEDYNGFATNPITSDDLRLVGAFYVEQYTGFHSTNYHKPNMIWRNELVYIFLYGYGDTFFIRANAYRDENDEIKFNITEADDMGSFLYDELTEYDIKDLRLFKFSEPNCGGSEINDYYEAYMNNGYTNVNDIYDASEIMFEFAVPAKEEIETGIKEEMERLCNR